MLGGFNFDFYGLLGGKKKDQTQYTPAQQQQQTQLRLDNQQATKTFNNLGRYVLGTPAKFLNTAATIPADLTDVAGLAKTAITNPKNFAQATADAKARIDARTYAQKGGLFDAGTTFASPQELNDPGTFARKTIGTGVEIASDIAPGLKIAKGAGIGTRILAQSGYGAGVGAAGNLGNQVIDGGPINIGEIGANAGFGALTGGLIEGVPAATRAIQARRAAGQVAQDLPTITPTIKPTELTPEQTPVSFEANQAAVDARRLREQQQASQVPLNRRIRDAISPDNSLKFQRQDRSFERETGQTLLPSQRFDDMLQEARGSSNIIAKRLQANGYQDWIESLGKIGGKNGKDEFNLYAQIRTAEERAKVNQKRGESLDDAYARYSGGRDLAQDTNYRQQLEGRYGKSFDQARGIVDDQLQHLVDTGQVEPQVAQVFRSQYKDYLPMYRALSDDLATFKTGRGIAGVQVRMNKLRGGTSKAVDDMAGNIYRYTTQDVNKQVENRIRSEAIRRDEVRAAMGLDRKMYSVETANDIRVRRDEVPGEVDPKTPNGGRNTITRMVDGLKETYAVTDPELYSVLEKLPAGELNRAMMYVGIPVRIFKLFTTGLGNPAFVTSAVVKDLVSSILFSKSPIRAILSPDAVWQGMKAATVGSDFLDALKGQGAGLTQSAQGRTLTKTADALFAERSLASKSIHTLKNPEEWLGFLEQQGDRFDTFTRVKLARAAYSQAKAKGLPEEEAIIEGAKSYREDAVNMVGRYNTMTRNVNQVVPYLNATLQGGALFRRRFAEDPLGMTVRASVLGGMVSGVIAYNTSDPDRKFVYDDIKKRNPDLANNNLLLIGPNARNSYNPDTQDYGDVIKVPLNPDLGFFVNSIRRLAEADYKKDPLSYMAQAQNVVSMFTGLDVTSGTKLAGQLTPIGVKQLTEDAGNKSLTFNSPIVPQYLQDKFPNDPSKQAYDTTPGTYKLIGQMLGKSPLVIQNYASGLFGANSGMLAAATDRVLNQAGLISKDDVSDKDVLKGVIGKFYGAKGVNPTTEMFNQVTSLSNKMSDPQDRKIFQSMFTGNTDKTFMDSATRAGNILNSMMGNSEVYDALKQMDVYNRNQGKPGDPFWDLSADQQKKVLFYRYSKLANQTKQNYDKNGVGMFAALGLDESWYQDYQKANSAYFDKLDLPTGSSSTPTSITGAEKPKLNDQQQGWMDTYSALPKGTGARSAWIKSNPDKWGQIQEFFAASNSFTNEERAALGLEPTDESGASSGGSGKGGSRRSYSYSGGQTQYARMQTRTGTKKPTISIKKGKRIRVRTKKASTKVPTGATKL